MSNDGMHHTRRARKHLARGQYSCAVAELASAVRNQEPGGEIISLTRRIPDGWKGTLPGWLRRMSPFQSCSS